MAVRLVAFDVGEVLVDETRLWSELADWLGISRLTFLAAFGAVISEGRHHLDVFQLLRPGFDAAAARRERGLADWWSRLQPGDLYPDALPCLRRLRQRGYRVAIAGNQSTGNEPALRRLGIDADFYGSSAAWGVEKPAAGFFERLIAETGLPPHEIAYVGDRLDNDVMPAMRAGLVAVFLRRGPWAVIHATQPEAAAVPLRIDSLDELPDVLDPYS